MPEAIVVQVQIPEMTIEKYAELVGVTTATVRNWCNRGYLPTVKTGKRRMINLAARAVECVKEDVRA